VVAATTVSAARDRAAFALSRSAEHLIDDLVEAFDVHEISPPNANRSDQGKDGGIKF
jgi:hypothetical protein